MKKSKLQYQNISVVQEPIRAWSMGKNKEVMLQRKEMLFVSRVGKELVYIDYEKLPYVISLDDYLNKSTDYLY